MKFDPKDHRGTRQGVFMSAVEGLATMIAIVSAFFLTPELYYRTVGFVIEFTASRYGPALADFMPIIWFGVVGLMTFFVARATLATAIVAAGLAIAVRFV